MLIILETNFLLVLIKLLEYLRRYIVIFEALTDMSPPMELVILILTIVDDYSRAEWVYLMIDKTKIFRMFMNFVAMVHRQFSSTIKN